MWVVGRGFLKSSVAAFCWLLKIANVWVQCCWVSRLLRLVMDLVEIGVGHGEVMVKSCVVMGVGPMGFAMDF